jgi:predicted PurR-regulated permease PerM
MNAARIQARDVVKIVAIALVVIAIAVLLALVLLNVRTTLRWVVAAIFLALALAPAVSLVERLRVRARTPPRWLAILVVYMGFAALFIFITLQVIPPIVREVEGLASQLPAYVSDFEDWAEKSEAFQDLNQKYDITQTLSEQAKALPSKLGSAAGEAGSFTVKLLHNLLAAITVLALAFFLLLDNGRIVRRALDRLPSEPRERGRRIAAGIYRVVRSYVSVNLVLAAAAGLFTWGMLELLGVDLAVPLAVIVAFLDLVPLIGLTAGGLLVAAVAALHDFPGALIVWVIAFLVYQQLQDRVVQPLLYRNAVRINPAVAIVAILVGAELVGILGALLAIPVAASIGVVAGELLRPPPEAEAAPRTGEAAPLAPQPEPAAD